MGRCNGDPKWDFMQSMMSARPCCSILIQEELHILLWRGVRVVDGDALEMRSRET
jgi:hypothetical protein